jgi:hypothetical protein
MALQFFLISIQSASVGSQDPSYTASQIPSRYRQASSSGYLPQHFAMLLTPTSKEQNPKRPTRTNMKVKTVEK